MKTTLYSLLAAAACGMVLGQTAYTTPVGYTTQTLTPSVFNVVGLNVLTPTLVAGKITTAVAGVSSTVVTVAGVDFTAALPVGKMCIFEITSGTKAGTVQEFVTWSGSTVTLPVVLSGIVDGVDTFSVRVASTVQEIFPVGLLAGSSTATNADKVWLPVGNGTYTKYWYKAAGANIGWHTTTTGVNDTGLVAGDIPIVYTDGILVEKKAAAASLIISGEVKKTASSSIVVQGYNLIGVTPPAGSTLFTCGVYPGIAGSSTATNADKVWIPLGNGTYTKYWYKAAGANIGWHTTTSGTNDTGLVPVDVDLKAGLYIQRISASGTPFVVPFTVPSSYSGL